MHNTTLVVVVELCLEPVGYNLGHCECLVGGLVSIQEVVPVCLADYEPNLLGSDVRLAFRDVSPSHLISVLLSYNFTYVD